MDMSFMSKFLVTGRDAGAVLNRLATSDVVPRAGEDGGFGGRGRITYCQFLNERAKLEADLTVCALPPECNTIGPKHQRYLVVATDTAHRHVESMIHKLQAGVRCVLWVCCGCAMGVLWVCCGALGVSVSLSVVLCAGCGCWGQ